MSALKTRKTHLEAQEPLCLEPGRCQLSRSLESESWNPQPLGPKLHTPRLKALFTLMLESLYGYTLYYTILQKSPAPVLVNQAQARIRCEFFAEMAASWATAGPLGLRS